MSILVKVIRKLRKLYAKKIERLPYVNWFNPFLTLYVNLKCFPFRQAIKFPLFVYGRPKIYSLFGTMKCIDSCRPGMIKFNSSDVEAPCASSGSAELNLWGMILFHGCVEFIESTKIYVGENGVLELGTGVRIMHQCCVYVHKKIKIGNCCRISHRSQLMDSNCHYIVNMEKREIQYLAKEISIGNRCWICNSSSIAAGSIIPDEMIVGSNSLVNKRFDKEPAGTILAGVPAKPICQNRYRVYNKQLETLAYTFFQNNPNQTTYLIPDEFNSGNV